MCALHKKQKPPQKCQPYMVVPVARYDSGKEHLPQIPSISYFGANTQKNNVGFNILFS